MGQFHKSISGSDKGSRLDPEARAFDGCSAVGMTSTLPNKSFICVDYFMLIVPILEPESILYMNKERFVFLFCFGFGSFLISYRFPSIITSQDRML